MKLLHVPLKLIKTFSLTSSEEHQQLTVDVEKWESTAVEESPDKVKAMYAKIHKGVLVRVLMPFVFFFAVRWVRDLMAEPSDELEL